MSRDLKYVVMGLWASVLLVGPLGCGGESEPETAVDAAVTPMMDAAELAQDMGVLDAAAMVDAAPAILDAALPEPDAAPEEDEWTLLLGPCAHRLPYNPDPAGPPVRDPFMDAFRRLDFDLLPTRWRTEDLAPIERSVVVFTLGLETAEYRDKLTKADLLENKPMGVVVAAAFASPGNRLNYDLLLAGLSRFYNCGRGFPPTLEAFRETVFDYENAEMNEIASAAKCVPRRLYEDDDLHVYVAETVDDGVVRETEIILGRDGSGEPLDFAVYDEQGRLSDRSTFPTAGGSLRTIGSPQVCMACHVNLRSRTLFDYDDLIPDGTGLCAQ